MEPTDKQLVLDIVERAQKGEYTKERFIKSLDEFIEYSGYARSTKVIIKLLKRSSKKLFKAYCKEVSKGTADVEELLAYVQLDEIVKFYLTDLNILQRMLDEYKDYLCQGNFISALLGEERDI